MSALLQAPDGDLEQDGAPSDHRLVAAVRRGDDRAFEALYERYHRRIHAYVFGMVKDHQRAEDVTQEVFVSALRRMRATERPIAFKPWVYEIAKNACIDQFRRSRRAEEISYDADEGLAPSDYGRLVSHEPIPDAALVAKQQLDDLCGAFGGLSDAHHRILVLRELEGLSYREIGERMGMSRPAVESTLFRARRRLTEEYDELASGQRCQRIQSIIANAGSGRLGARDTRRLARHVAHCQPCRREAVAAGMEAALVARRPVRTRIAEKVAALFPFPFLLRGRKDGGAGDGWASQLPVVSDQAAAGTAKLAAAAVVLVAGLGAGVDSHTAAPVDPTRDRGGDRAVRDSSRTLAQPSQTRRVAPPAQQQQESAGEARERTDLRSRRGEARGRDAGAEQPTRGQASTPDKAAVGGGGGGEGATPVGADVDTGGGGGAVPQAVTDQADGATGDTAADRRIRIEVQVPQVELPTEGPQGGSLQPEQAVGNTVDTVENTVGTVQDTVKQTTDAVDQTTDDVTGALPLQQP
jgi:RNA polymerase sigma factor (sigma-70 family)